MKALILAAGRGSRMGPLTQEEPKCLVRLGERTLLARQLESLRAGGCETIGIVTGYRGELLAPYADHVFCNSRWAQTNMVASLCAAESWLAREPVIVSYSDIFYAPQTVRRLRDADGALAITYDVDWYALWAARAEDPLADAETFKLNAQGCVIEIGRRATRREDVEGQYMGLLKFTPAIWPQIGLAVETLPPERRDRLDMTSLLSLLIARGVEIQAVACEGVWGECDTASDVALYTRWIADGRLAP